MAAALWAALSFSSTRRRLWADPGLESRTPGWRAGPRAGGQDPGLEGRTTEPEGRTTEPDKAAPVSEALTC